MSENTHSNNVGKNRFKSQMQRQSMRKGKKFWTVGMDEEREEALDSRHGRGGPGGEKRLGHHTEGFGRP